MKKQILVAAIIACASIHSARAQGGGTWTPLITQANGGWANLTGTEPYPAGVRPARAIHMVHLRPTNPAMGNTGRLLFWGRSSQNGQGVTPYVWNPFDLTNPNRPFGTFTQTTPLGYEAFCCGQALMADGKVLIAGTNFGTTEFGEPPHHYIVPGPNVSVLNPDTLVWSQMPPSFELQRSRYYPAVTRMPAGKMVVNGGQAKKYVLPNDPENPHPKDEFDVEPFEVNPDTVNALAAWQMPVAELYDFLNYPFVFPVSPSEMIFVGPSRHNGGVYVDNWLENYPTFYFSTSAAGDEGGRILFGGSSETWHGSVVLMNSVVYKSGGLSRIHKTIKYGNLPATNEAEYLPIGSMSTDPLWTFAASMNYARIDHNLVALPNGKILALGGSLYHDFEREEPVNWVNQAEIYDPGTNVWTNVTDPDANTFRGYHSTAILLPDGRVVLSGGDVGFDEELPGQPPSAQIFTPNYGAGTRPQITAGPDEIQIGSVGNSISVNDSSVSKAVLIGLGAVTHSYDMNQRYVELDLTGTGNPLVKHVKGPNSSTQAPVGWYMLFVLKPDGQGNMLPCQLAKYVKVVLPSR